MYRKHNAIIPALLAGLLAGCGGGRSRPDLLQLIGTIANAAK